MAVKYSLWNTLRCVCHRCSSYPGILKELRRYCMPGVFCAKGTSCTEVTKRGCACPSCVVYKTHGLQDSYYCVHGKAKTPPEDKRELLIILHEEKVPVSI